jgi:hypothetical protein
MLYRNNQKETKAKNLLQIKNDKIKSTLSQLKNLMFSIISPKNINVKT